MEHKKYNSEKHDFIQKNRLLLISNVVLTIIVCVLVIKLAGSKDRLVIIPPHLDQRVVVAYDAANEHYHKSFSTYVATLIGNVNPGNSDLVAEWLKMAFAPQLYSKLRSSISESAESMRRTGRSLRFIPDGLSYDPDTSHTFVHGIQEVIDINGKPDKVGYVYEFKVEIVNGLPAISFFDRYPGNARSASAKREDRKRSEAKSRKG